MDWTDISELADIDLLDFANYSAEGVLLLLFLALLAIWALASVFRNMSNTLGRFRGPTSDLRRIDRMSGPEFEQWCAAILRRNGFNPVRVMGGSGDQGMDVMGMRHGQKWLIQCKRYNKPVGNKAVQEAYAGKAYYRCQKAAVMSNTYFTSGAKELAKRTGVLLWDRDELKKLIHKTKLI